MQDSGVELSSPMADASPGRPAWTDLVILLLLSIALHAWLISHTTVVSRDTIGFVRYALMLERLPWREALPRLEQHPLYPAAILTASLPLRHFLGDASVSAFALASQLAAALGGILLVVPMYYLGRDLFDRRIAFWSAALFQCLPVCAQVTSDGLSDGLYLVFLATALLFAVRALRSGSVLQFGLCGFASGVSYLGRPEGLLLVGAVLIVLAGMQLVRAERLPWRRALLGSAGLLAGAAVAAGPYMAIIGGLTVKQAANKILRNAQPQDTLFQTSIDPPLQNHACLATNGPLLASTFAIWWMDQKQAGPPPWSWGVRAVAVELVHGFQYVALALAIFGLWWYRGRLRSDAGARVVLLWCVILGLLLLRVALGVHYLSERHMLAIVMCGSLWAGAALVRIADALPYLVARHWPRGSRVALALQLACLLATTGWCLPASLRSLHVNRAGHRAAGEWLAAHAGPTDHVTDPHCWALFYSGFVFKEGLMPAKPHAPATEYVVVTVSKNPHARLAGVDAAEERARYGSKVFCWTPTRQQRQSYGAEQVDVYAVPTP